MAVLLSHPFTAADGSAPSSFTNYTSSATATVQSNQLRHDVTGTGYAIATSKAAGSNIADSEVYCDIDFNALDDVEAYAMLGLRTTTTAAYLSNGYCLTLAQGDGSPTNYQLDIREWNSGGLNPLASSVVTLPFLQAPIRALFRAEGTALKAKAWALIDPEPEAWSVETTDATHATGVAFLSTMSGNLNDTRTFYDNFLWSDFTGQPKVWNGSAWVAKPAKVWNGSAWVEKPAKVWNGSAWVLA